MPAKIYERHWTQANGNALSFPNSANGDSKCFALNFPHECVIQNIMCVQVVGTTGADFDLTLYNLPRANIAPSEAHGEATGIPESASLVQATDFALGKIGDTLTAGLGSDQLPINSYKTIQWHAMDGEFTTGMYHRNMEGTQTNPKRRIFVQIDVKSVAGPEDRVWELALTCIPANPH